MKYYTPKIKEFHVGFKCEMKNSSDIKYFDWEKCKFKEDFSCELNEDYCFEYLRTDLKEENIRVKYLDKQDIEKVLQVKQLKGDDYELNFQIQIEDSEDFYEIDYDVEDNKLTVEFWKEIGVNGYSCSNLFCGKIKNKSELIKLLTQLEITI